MRSKPETRSEELTMASESTSIAASPPETFSAPGGTDLPGAPKRLEQIRIALGSSSPSCCSQSRSWWAKGCTEALAALRGSLSQQLEQPGGERGDAGLERALLRRGE